MSSLLAVVPSFQVLPEDVSPLVRSRIRDLRSYLHVMLRPGAAAQLDLNLEPVSVERVHKDVPGSDVEVLFRVTGPSGASALVRLQRIEITQSGRTTLYGFRTIQGEYLSTGDACVLLGV